MTISGENGSASGLRVAVVGATGAVGSTMLGILRERRFPAAEVVPFASERSAGRTIDHGDDDLAVRALSPEAIQGFDIALFSAGGGVSREWAPRFAEAGCVVVDNSSYWRMDDARAARRRRGERRRARSTPRDRRRTPTAPRCRW